MNAPTKLRMTADEFIRWAMEQPEGHRYELADGEVFPMSPERFGHIETKGNVYFALRLAIQRCSAQCRVYADGASIRIDDSTVYEPDVIVRCGEPLSKDAVETSDPVIVVEVLSPSTRSLDTSAKLIGYFRLPSVQHYLVVNSKGGKPHSLQATHGRDH
jgi:Uma2 family endonuclease